MASLTEEKPNRFEAVEDIAVTSHITFGEKSGQTVDAGISSQKDIIAIAALSIQDNADHSHDKDTSGRPWSDKVSEIAKVNGGQASTGSSHKYSTRRNLSNMLAAPSNVEQGPELTNGRESSLSGTPSSAEGYRDEMLAQWLASKPWPSGPSFDFDGLSEEARQLRGMARSSALASVGTGFGVAVERGDNYPQDILIEEDMDVVGEVPAKSS